MPHYWISEILIPLFLNLIVPIQLPEVQTDCVESAILYEGVDSKDLFLFFYCFSYLVSLLAGFG